MTATEDLDTVVERSGCGSRMESQHRPGHTHVCRVEHKDGFCVCGGCGAYFQTSARPR